MLQYIIAILWYRITVVHAGNNKAIKNELSWTYDDESEWPGSCRSGSRRQSPIDIKTDDVIKDYKNQYIKYGPLQFTGYKKALVSGINNGHTVQFSSEGDEEMHPKLTGGPLKTSYRLEQMHFHWLSEHAINGIKYAMEIHFVHVRYDLSVDEALKKRDGLAILAVFGNVLADLDEPCEALNEVMDYIPRLKDSGDRISGLLMDMTKLLSPNTRSYYAYDGSLTSPECNEAVVWIIFEVPIYLSDAQYKMFGKIGVGRHNFRSLQKLNRQIVFSPTEIKSQTPQIIVFFEDVYRLITGLFRNITSFVTSIRSR